jgi:hypothetical protein
MNKIPSEIVFFSGQINPKEIASLEVSGQEKDRVKLAYTDKNFTVGNLALSSFLDNTLFHSKV